jgi:hypothetical protein
MRELAETRRQLGIVLNVIEGQAAVFTAPELATVLAALDEAAEYKRDRAAACGDCDVHPAGLCSTCSYRLDRADEYDALAERLQGGTQ